MKAGTPVKVLVVFNSMYHHTLSVTVGVYAITAVAVVEGSFLKLLIVKLVANTVKDNVSRNNARTVFFILSFFGL